MKQVPEQGFSEVAQKFFYIYSRLEFALKREGMINSDASANWDRFAKDLGRAFFTHIVESRVAAYLIANPPKRQINRNGVLDWQDARSVSNAASLFGAIRTARNNLFHGGKFPQGPLSDSARDERLLRDCIAVLEAALDSHKAVSQAFHAEQ